MKSIIILFTVLAGVSVWAETEIRPACGTDFDAEFAHYNLENLHRIKSAKNRSDMRTEAELQIKANQVRHQLSHYRTSILSGDCADNESERQVHIDAMNAELTAFCAELAGIEVQL